MYVLRKVHPRYKYNKLNRFIYQLINPGKCKKAIKKAREAAWPIGAANRFPIPNRTQGHLQVQEYIIVYALRRAHPRYTHNKLYKLIKQQKNCFRSFLWSRWELLRRLRRLSCRASTQRTHWVLFSLLRSSVSLFNPHILDNKKTAFAVFCWSRWELNPRPKTLPSQYLPSQ